MRQFDVARDLSKRFKDFKIKDKDRKYLEGTFVNMTKNTNAEYIYIPSDDIIQYYRSIRSNPKRVLAGLGVSTREFDTVMQSGGDFRLLTSKVLTRLAGTKAGDFLLQRASFDPGHSTQNKAPEQNRKGWAIILEISNELSKQYQVGRFD